MAPFDIVIASHGDLAAALLSAAESLSGRLERVRALGLGADETPESFEVRLRAELHSAAGPVLVLTDLYGGTPQNVVGAVSREVPVHSIAGVNLGLVLEAVTTTDALSADIVDRFVERARDAVVNAGARLAAAHETKTT